MESKNVEGLQSQLDETKEKLKREFGKYVTFWGGGVDTRNVLPSKSPDEVKEDVKKRIGISNKGEKNGIYGKPSPMKGKKHSEETKRKIAETLKKKKF